MERVPLAQVNGTTDDQNSKSARKFSATNKIKDLTTQAKDLGIRLSQAEEKAEEITSKYRKAIKALEAKDKADEEAYELDRDQ